MSLTLLFPSTCLSSQSETTHLYPLQLRVGFPRTPSQRDRKILSLEQQVDMIVGGHISAYFISFGSRKSTILKNLVIVGFCLFFVFVFFGEALLVHLLDDHPHCRIKTAFFFSRQIFGEAPDLSVPLPSAPSSRSTPRRSKAICLSSGRRKARLYSPALCLADNDSEF